MPLAIIEPTLVLRDPCCRYQRLWQPLPGFPAPATIWLVREQLEAEGQPQWILIDAGFPDRWSDAWNTQMMAALRKMVPPGHLKAILCEPAAAYSSRCRVPPADREQQNARFAVTLGSFCKLFAQCIPQHVAARLWCISHCAAHPRPCAVTHSHTDHVSGVPGLLATYPEAALVVHEKEVPFLTGEAKHLPNPGTFWRVLRALGLVNGLITVRSEGQLRGSMHMALHLLRGLLADCCITARPVRWPLLQLAGSAGHNFLMAMANLNHSPPVHAPS